MAHNRIADQTFDKSDFSENGLDPGEYDNCIFQFCNFTGVDLHGVVFVECSFVSCNFSNAALGGCAFREVKFTGNKMLGLRFDQCNTSMLEMQFENCTLNFTSFYGLRLRKIRFTKCSMQEVDFTQTDLFNAVLDECDLLRAHFENTILEKTDFRTSYNYSLDPDLNMLTGAKFSQDGLAGLLDKYKIEIS